MIFLPSRSRTTHSLRIKGFYSLTTGPYFPVDEGKCQTVDGRQWLRRTYSGSDPFLQWFNKDESQKQYLLQLVSSHRTIFSVPTKAKWNNSELRVFQHFNDGIYADWITSLIIQTIFHYKLNAAWLSSNTAVYISNWGCLLLEIKTDLKKKL